MPVQIHRRRRHLIRPRIAQKESRVRAFLRLIRHSLSAVDLAYYGRGWLYDLEREAGRHVGYEREAENLFKTYNERVFCYELYHQIRLRMETTQARNANATPPVYFQAELLKRPIGEGLREQYHVEELKERYSPDFLLHEPTNFRNQLLVIEVKSNPNLRFDHIKPDLSKLNEFVRNYKYHMGLFLTVNTSPEAMLRILTMDETQNWIVTNLSHRRQILFWCKQVPDTELREWSLGNLPPRLD